jgi:alpha-beta hydrolase superfamily lysophospholipase
VVQPEIAQSTRVCAHDRAGMGWSERGPRPRDMNQHVAELRALLAGAGIDPPYVLVGHSGVVRLLLPQADYDDLPTQQGAALIRSGSRRNTFKSSLTNIAPCPRPISRNER